MRNSIDKTDIGIYIIDVVSTQSARVLNEKGGLFGGTFREKGKNSFCDY